MGVIVGASAQLIEWCCSPRKSRSAAILYAVLLMLSQNNAHSGAERSKFYAKI